MLKVSFLISCTLAFIFLTTHLAAAQQNPPDSTGKTCEAFAKEFYTWYLSAARAGVPHGVWPPELTLKAKPPVLSEELVRGINDVEAEAKRTQDAGLDFDPVLNSQDSGGPGNLPT